MFAHEQRRQHSHRGQSDVPARPTGAARTEQKHPVLQLRRMLGNQALERLFETQHDSTDAISTTASPGRPLSRTPLRTKASTKNRRNLTISTPGDTHEQEADRISDQVMRISDSQLHHADSQLHRVDTRLQRACHCGAQCPKCQANQPDTEHEGMNVRRSATGEIGPATPPPIVHEALSTPGHPLDALTRDFMEPRFGRDLSHVRIHTDRKAAESSRAVNASAYTVGNDVVIGAGAYSPRTLAGQRLLAHELVHTLQQDDSTVVHRQSELDIVLNSPGVKAKLLGSETLDGFKLNSHTLTSDHKRRLTDLAQRLKQLLQENQLGTVVITGHTDATGDERLNKQLGQDRADAVAAFLRKSGVRPIALQAQSEGESALRVPTERAEPLNRRVEIDFVPELPAQTQEPETRTSVPETAETPEEPPRIPRPENFCTEYPEKCEEIANAEPTPDCGSTADCSAVSLDRFEKQPAALRKLIERSFPDDPAGWFDGLPRDLQMALTSIFNRMCKYGLLCEVR